MFWPMSVSQRKEVAAPEGKGPILRREGEEREGVGLLETLTAPPLSQPPLTPTRPPAYPHPDLSRAAACPPTNIGGLQSG